MATTGRVWSYCSTYNACLINKILCLQESLAHLRRMVEEGAGHGTFARDGSYSTRVYVIPERAGGNRDALGRHEGGKDASTQSLRVSTHVTGRDHSSAGYALDILHGTARGLNRICWIHNEGPIVLIRRKGGPLCALR